jgi:tRNA threonylcarbamoyl adenosine modification protein YeaZ
LLTLSLDTATDVATACLTEDGEVLAESMSRGRSTAAQRLLADVHGLFGSARREPSELDAIVAGTGPGPYTGLRVGLVTAAVMARTLGIPAYGVCSLDGIPPRVGEVLVATDARRKEVYWARYRDGERIAGPEVARPADVAVDAAVIVGAGARLYPDVFGPTLTEHDHPDPVELVRRATDRIRRGAPADPLTPRYLRRPDAVEPGPPKAVRQ